METETASFIRRAATHATAYDAPSTASDLPADTRLGSRQRVAAMVRITLVDGRDADVERTAVSSVCYPVDLSPGIFIPATICADDAADSDTADSNDATASHVTSGTINSATTVVATDGAADAAAELASSTTPAASTFISVAVTVAILAAAVTDAIDSSTVACFALMGEAVVEQSAPISDSQGQLETVRVRGRPLRLGSQASARGTRPRGANEVTGSHGGTQV